MISRKLTKWTMAALAAAMAAGLCPVSAFAEGAAAEALKQLSVGGVNYYYADTKDDASDTVYQATLRSRTGTTVYDFSKADLTQVEGTDYYYTVLTGTTPLSGNLYGYKGGTATTYAKVYEELGVATDSSYDAISSATEYTGHHAKDIPSMITYGTDAQGKKAITGMNLGRETETVQAKDVVEGSILKAERKELSAAQTDALNLALKANPMTAPRTSKVTPKLASASYTTSKYGKGEFAIVPDDTVEGYNWSEYWSNVYAATVSDGTHTVGAVHWIDLYGEAATSGPHYNKIQLALNHGQTPASNQAQVSRYAKFFDENTGALKPGTYTIKIYAEGYDVLEAKVTVPAYVLMNIPYAKFYGPEGVSNADIVSSATLKNLNQNLAPGSYHDGYLYSDEEAKEATVRGVTYPVHVSDAAVLGTLKKVSKEDKAEITVATGKTTVGNKEAEGSDLLFASGDYAYYVLDEEPAYYKELSGMSVNDFAFSEIKKAAESASGMDVTVRYTGHHTNIEFIVSAEGLNDAVVTAVTVTADGKKYALRHIEEIWRNVELGWNWTDIDGAGLAGKTVTNVTYYMKGADGSYQVKSYDVNAYIKPQMTGEHAASFKNRKNVEITGLPADIRNAKATVKSKVGRGETPVVIAENADAADGKIVLTDAAAFDTTYSITLGSDNYADIMLEAECKDTRAAGSVTGTASYEKTAGDAPFVLDAKSEQALTFASSDEKVVTVDQTGKVTIVGAGSAAITVDGAETDDVKAASLVVNVTVKEAKQPAPAADEEEEAEKKAAEEKAAKEAAEKKAAEEKAAKEAAEKKAAKEAAEKKAAEEKAAKEAAEKKAAEEKAAKEKAAKEAAEKKAAEEKAAKEAAEKKAAEEKAAKEAAEKKAAEEKAAKEAAAKKAAAAKAVVKGKTYTVKKMKYQVTNANTAGKGTVTITGTTAKKNKLKKLTIPASVKIGGASFKVTAVKAGAFKGFKKLTKVTVGANVTSIGKNAFSGDKKLKTITIKSMNLKKVGSKAIKGIAKKATIKVPKAKLKAYKKLFKKSTGFTKKKMKIRK